MAGALDFDRFNIRYGVLHAPLGLGSNQVAFLADKEERGSLDSFDVGPEVGGQAAPYLVASGLEPEDAVLLPEGVLEAVFVVVRGEAGVTLFEPIQGLSLVLEAVGRLGPGAPARGIEGRDVDEGEALELVGVLGGEDHAHHSADAVAYEDAGAEPELGVAAPHHLGVVGQADAALGGVAVAVIEDGQTQDLIFFLEALGEGVHAVPVHPHAVDEQDLVAFVSPLYMMNVIASVLEKSFLHESQDKNGVRRL